MSRRNFPGLICSTGAIYFLHKGCPDAPGYDNLFFCSVGAISLYKETNDTKVAPEERPVYSLKTKKATLLR